MKRERQRPFLLQLASAFWIGKRAVPEVIWAVLVGNYQYCYLRIIFNRVYSIRSIRIMLFDMYSQAFQNRVSVPSQKGRFNVVRGEHTQDLNDYFQEHNFGRRLLSVSRKLLLDLCLPDWLACVVWSNAKLEELPTSKYLPFPREFCELTMT